MTHNENLSLCGDYLVDESLVDDYNALALPEALTDFISKIFVIVRFMPVRFLQLALQTLRNLRVQGLLSVLVVAIIGIIAGVVVNTPLAEWAA